MICTVLKDNRSGMAVLITLTVITLLLATAMELNRKAGSSIEKTAVTRDFIVMDHMAASAIEAGMGLLVKDKKASGEVDSLQEEWADPTIISELMDGIPFEDGAVALAIMDELSRIQVNAIVKFPEGRETQMAQYNMWLEFLGYAKLFAEGLDDDDTSASALASSIKDWIDSGDDDAIEGVSGAESDYYQDLEMPYSCPNGPIRDLNEMLLIKGMAKFLDVLGGIEMVRRYMTVHGMTDADGKKFTYPGRININTAEVAVIAALLKGEDKMFAQDIVDYRDEQSEGQFVHQDLANPAWYKQAPGLGDVTIEPELITTQSDFFRLEATAELHKQQRRTVAVVKREKDTESGKYYCRILSWTTE